MKKIFFLLALILQILLNCGCSTLNTEVKNMKITKEDAVKIANKELLRQKFDVKQKNIIVDENNTLWHTRYLSDNKFKESNPHIIEKLKNKDYWALYYTPKEPQSLLGGEAWIFVDKNTGEIIQLFYLK